MLGIFFAGGNKTFFFSEFYVSSFVSSEFQTPTLKEPTMNWVRQHTDTTYSIGEIICCYCFGISSLYLPPPGDPQVCWVSNPGACAF